MTRWFRQGLSVPGPFVCRCLNVPIMLRFHTPLVEPDVQFSRIRLSEETSRFRPRKAACPLGEAGKSKRIVEDFVRKSPGRRSCHFVFGTQPLTQPSTGMLVHRPILGDHPKAATCDHFKTGHSEGLRHTH